MLMTILALVVSATIDSTTLLIGDQTDMHLRATCQTNERVQMPVLGSELTPGIEIVDRTIVDSTILKDGRVQYDQYYTITSFQDSLFNIHPLPFVVNGDTIWSEEMTLNVLPIEVDSTNDLIIDIKGVYEAPIWWWGVIRWVLLVLLLAGLGVAGYYLYLYIQRKKQNANDANLEVESLRLAEEVALEKLDLIKEQKIWQQGYVKEYYTQLTDVIREYIARRYGVSSIEQTSDETLRALRPLLNDRKDLYEQLRNMLTTADLVKFAKWITTADENELSLRNAYTFVKETTPVVQETQNDQEL